VRSLVASTLCGLALSTAVAGCGDDGAAGGDGGAHDDGGVGPDVDAGGGPGGSVVPSDAGSPTEWSVQEVRAGRLHTCALRRDGAVYCWGQGAYRALGGDYNFQGMPRLVEAFDDAVAIAAGKRFGCARRAGGEVVCWGDNSWGELGDGTFATRDTPASVPGLAGVVEVAAGWGFFCARRMAGDVVCWGHNTFGQLGSGRRTVIETPEAIAGLGPAAGLVSGFETCARRSDGTVACVGATFCPSDSARSLPTTTPVPGLGDVDAIAGLHQHRCALRTDGTAACWGCNSEGELGDGTTDDSFTPVDVSGVPALAEIDAGSVFSCARDTAGSVWCWGINTAGELGDGTTTSRTTPALVTGISDAAKLSTGRFHSCVVRAGGGVSCWGSNFRGRLGDGSGGGVSAISTTPVDVVGLADAAQVAIFDAHSCAVTTTGSVHHGCSRAGGRERHRRRKAGGRGLALQLCPAGRRWRLVLR